MACATPTGTPCPAFPQVPIPGSSIILFPTNETSFKIDGPSPINVAPFDGRTYFSIYDFISFRAIKYKFS